MYACVYEVYWNFGGRLYTGSVMKYVGLGSGVGLVKIESSAWQTWWCILQLLGDALLL